jgi:SAM-dependent methyltransferase
LTPAERTFEAERLEIIATLERSHFWFVARRALVGRLLARRPLPPASVVLDVGCGTGTFAADLARRGARVIALDFRPEGLARLRAEGTLAWTVRAITTALPVTTRSIDVVLALDVLEHTDDVASLEEIVRVLKPGGALLLTVPALPSLWSARDDEAGHLRRYTRRGLLDLVRGSGLEPIDVRFYQCLLLPLFAVTRFIGKRFASAQRTEERPGGLVNRVCLAINQFEVAAGEFVRWPWGSSLAALVRKPVI